METLNRYTPLVGRILMSTMFLVSGYLKVVNWPMMRGLMESKGMPAASVLLGTAVVIELLGGLSLVLGYKSRAAAAIMFLYLIPVTLAFHNYWASQGIERFMQLANFYKNLSIMGGLLLLSANGPGPISIDGSERA